MHAAGTTRLLRATYAGDAVWRRSFSPEQLLRVAPLVALAPDRRARGVRGRRVRRARAGDAAQATRLPGAPAAHPRRLPARGRALGAGARRALPQLVRAGLRRPTTACTCWPRADAATDRGRSPLRVVRVARR